VLAEWLIEPAVCSAREGGGRGDQGIDQPPLEAGSKRKTGLHYDLFILKNIIYSTWQLRGLFYRREQIFRTMR